jgi:hypothetical protein
MRAPAASTAPAAFGFGLANDLQLQIDSLNKTITLAASNRSRIMHISRVLGILIFAIAGATGAAAQQLCSDSQFEDFALYVYQPGVRCWTSVPYLGTGEGTVNLGTEFSGATKFKGRGTAQLIVAIERAPDQETGLLVKERVYNPRAIATDTSNKLRDPGSTSDVSLERPAVRSGASVDLNVYNRYHAQTSGAIPLSGDLRQFHYSYPRSASECRATNDLASLNRAQFAFSGLNAEPSSGWMAWAPSIVSVGHAENSVYTRLKARNLFVKARPSDVANRRFALIPFQTNAQAFTRSEFTVVDLETRDSFSKHWPKTWQIDWIP